MAGDLENTLARLVRKTEGLADRYEVLRAAKRADEQRIRQLENELARSRGECAQLRSQVEYLTVVGVLHPERKDVARSRAVIARLVQEIDKCIADLNE